MSQKKPIVIKSAFYCPHCKQELDIENILGTREFASVYGRWSAAKRQTNGKGTGRPRKGETPEQYRARVSRPAGGQ
jgi:hypothetical protein